MLIILIPIEKKEELEFGEVKKFTQVRAKTQS